ncbi:MAG: ABC transporter permease [Eggerthellaceae bacterium]|nr:ABC transporter permease [Eggerthellaceae bacterium]
MSVADLFLETLSAFNANRARSLLTILGIVIGIAAVIGMTAIIGGVKGALVGEMGLTQARLVMINCTYGSGLLKNDVEDMARDLDDSFEAISPLVFSTSDISSTKEKARGLVYGTGPEHASIMGMNFVQGGYFTKADADSASLVAVIEEMGVKKLFGSTTAQAVGQTVRIGGSEYEIIGVLESTSAEESDNVKVYMPFNTCAQRVAGSANVSEVYALASEETDAEAAANAAREWLIERFRIPESEQDDSLYIVTMQSIIDQLNTMMASFQLLMTVVASISLVVGGIGIMNMMLTNVTERIREIGLRKALGARRRDITRQFLLESVCLTLIGGVFGIALGLLLAHGLAGIAGAALSLGEGVTLTPTIGVDTVLFVAAICVMIGIAFGYYPARRAARLDPVESLHYQ